MKKLLLLIFSIGVSVSAMAQLVGGNTYLINGTDNGTVSFASLRSAISYMQANGVSGTGKVILEFASPYDPTIVDAPAAGATKITIPAISGTSSTLGITIRPAVGFSTVLSANVDANGLLELDGTNYITIDGRQGGIGSIGLTIENTNALTTAGTAAVKFINDSHHNTLTYTILKCGTTNNSNTAGVVYFATAVGSGNSYNVVSYNEITSLTAAGRVSYGVLSAGTAAQPNTNNSILNNNISNFTFRAINLLTGTGGNWVINGNSLYSTVSITGTTMYGIYVSANTASDMTVNDNYIGGSAPKCGGAPVTIWSLNAIYLLSGAGTHLIQNNTISNISASYTYSTAPTGTALAHSCIYVSATGFINVLGNHIGSQSSQDNIVLAIRNTSTVEQTLLFYGIYVAGSGATAMIKDNDFGGITLNPLGTAAARYDGYYINSGSTISSMVAENNIVGGNIANSIRTTGTARPVWQLGILTSIPGASAKGNIIRNISSNSTANGIAGIYSSATSGSLTVLNNKIYALKNIAASGGPIYGVLLAGSSSTANFTIDNNFISLENANVATEIVNGIRKSGGTGNIDFRFNTIHIGGSGSTANQAIFTASSGNYNVRNNIFSNTYTAGGFNTGSAGTWNTNFNLYIYPSATTADANSQAFNYGDAGKPASAAVFFADSSSPYYMSVQSTFDSYFKLKGTPIAGITTDIGGNLRNVTTPSLGAYEANTTTLLPVNIKTFNAKLNNGKVNLTWTVGTETNVNHYEVERSANGKDFIKVATVTALGAANYSASDASPLIGINYYRLKGVDNDGTLSLFDELRSVKLTTLENSNVVVYPNPLAGNTINVSLSNYAGGDYKYKLLDAIGKVVQQGTINNNGSETSAITVSNSLNKGIYLLQLVAGDQVIQSKLVKR
ncbi:beta strand repeat-containing protein [Nubsella zeaxanthinifaciens]|jgi:hypothetical protein|uniref:beta strand repeat-containing protein n=1 Tax=Nubsella zeaxanthinifaciens TaxID=392412 RepID=UPI000DE331ED|nr:T9SS type A sorting domain-containing protein [Nubsella zeaxanthinifaciens]